MNKATGNIVESVATFGAFILIFSLFPSSDLVSIEGVSKEEVQLLFVIPIFLSVVNIIMVFSSTFKEIKLPAYISKGLNGFIHGTEAAFGLLSIFVAYSWYFMPENPKLEPLFIILGIVIALCEAARRLGVKVQATS